MTGDSNTGSPQFLAGGAAIVVGCTNLPRPAAADRPGGLTPSSAR